MGAADGRTDRSSCPGAERTKDAYHRRPTSNRRPAKPPNLLFRFLATKTKHQFSSLFRHRLKPLPTLTSSHFRLLGTTRALVQPSVARTGLTGRKAMMIKKILFPTDFSPNANHALLHALQLADFHNGELIVQHVVSDYFEKHSHWATMFDVHEFQKSMDCYVEAGMASELPNDAR